MNILEFRRFLTDRRIYTIESNGECFHTIQLCVNPNILQLDGEGVRLTLWRIRAVLVTEAGSLVFVRVLYSGTERNVIYSCDLTMRAADRLCDFT